MLSTFWSLDGSHIIRALTFIVGIASALTAWRAAALWRAASLIELPEFDPPIASMDDNPSLHILSTSVQLNEAQRMIAWSSEINARAARWASYAAVLTGLTVLLGVI